MFLNRMQALLTQVQLNVLMTMPAALLSELNANCVEITPLNAGLSNQNFRLHCHTGDKVLRVNTQASNWCDRNLEIASWQQAYLQQLAPALLWHSPCASFYLSEYIAQPLFNWSELSCEQGVGQQHCQQAINTNASDLLTNMLVCLHQLPIPSQAISVTEQYQQYLSQLNNTTALKLMTSNEDDIDKAWHTNMACLTDALANIDHWLATLEQCLIKPCFCHRDLSPFNLLLTANVKPQKLVCIDFEYAVASHPLFDLASVLATHNLTRNQYDEIIDHYINYQLNLTSPSLTPESDLAVDAALNIYWAFAAMWALLMLAQTPTSAKNAEQVDYQRCFNQYVGLIEH